MTDEALLAVHEVSTERNEHGTAIELPVHMDPALEAIAQRMREVASLPDGTLTHLRIRSCREGQGHPPHFDQYEIDGEQLVATVLLTLVRPDEGGETRFERARSGDKTAPIEVVPEVGDGLLWYNLADDSMLDLDAWHEGAAVKAGQKITLAGFIYAPPEDIAQVSELAPAPAVRERLYLLTDNHRARLEEQLAAACHAQRVELIEVNVETFDHLEAPALEDGAMLYRTATSHAACVVEQTLAHAGVATFYAHPLGAHLIHDNQALLLARCGVPTPRAVFSITDDRATLRETVAHLGGFPVILKVPGRSLGVGVMRLTDWPTLFSVVDQVYASQGPYATLMSCIEPAAHWRVIVIGEYTYAYLNPVREDDFRTYVDEEDQMLFTTPAPVEVIEAARDACAILGFHMGGVDVLWHDSGRAYVLEVNFPCYFGHPYDAVGEDIAAKMLEHLRRVAAERR